MVVDTPVESSGAGLGGLFGNLKKKSSQFAKLADKEKADTGDSFMADESNFRKYVD